MVIIMRFVSESLIARNINREILDIDANSLSTAVAATIRAEAEDTETNTDASSHLLEAELVNLVALVEEFDTLGATADSDEEIAISVRRAFAPSLDGLTTNNNTALAVGSAGLPLGVVNHSNPLLVSSEIAYARSLSPLLVEIDKVLVVEVERVSRVGLLLDEPLDERVLALTTVIRLLVVGIEVEIAESFEITALLEVSVSVNTRLLASVFLAAVVIVMTPIVRLATAIIIRIVARIARAVATRILLFLTEGNSKVAEFAPDNFETTTADNHTISSTITRVISEYTSTSSRATSRAINVEESRNLRLDYNRTTTINLEVFRSGSGGTIFISSKECETIARRETIRSLELGLESQTTNTITEEEVISRERFKTKISGEIVLELTDYGCLISLTISRTSKIDVSVNATYSHF
jgi:hypothetical protein